MTWKSWLGSVALVCAGLVAPGSGQVRLAADAHVNAEHSSVNSGAISNVAVGGGYTGLWQFDLSLLPPGTSSEQIARAVLLLYPNRVDTPGTLSLQPVTSAWSEETVTFSTMPSVGTAAATTNVAQAGAFVAVDVTTLVQGWVSAPATNFGVALTGGTAVVQFDSKENDLTSQPARLEVVLVSAGPAGPAGAVGPAGAAGPAGLAGTQGIPGSVGPAGPAGPAGLAGAAGPQGVPGVAGPMGFAGPAGVAGPAGPTGPIGPQGFQGLAGIAGAQGLVGPAGPAGASGEAGPQGPAGPQGKVGPTGASGAPGAIGPSGLQGPAGATGPQGATGATGPQGFSGAQGHAGPAGPPGINFRGAWSTAAEYAANDAVTFAGSTYLVMSPNSAVPPDQNASLWTLLAASGATGPSGMTGAASTVQVGSVTTVAPGSPASVVNVGSNTAAVLNFSIPQGAVGPPGSSGSGGGGAGVAQGLNGTGSVVHSVSFVAYFYSVSNANQSANEASSVLTWIPNGCTATQLSVYSQQAATITVTLRTGTPGSMADSPLSCQVAQGESCTSTGAVTVPSGGFLDLGITHADSVPMSVWSAVNCA